MVNEKPDVEDEPVPYIPDRNGNAQVYRPDQIEISLPINNIHMEKDKEYSKKRQPDAPFNDIEIQ